MGRFADSRALRGRYAMRERRLYMALTHGAALGLPGDPPAPLTRVRADGDELVVELEVADPIASHVQVVALGPFVTVHGDRLDASFRLPDDADADRLRVFHRRGRLELHAPRVRLVPRVVPVEERPWRFVHPEAEAC
jgi:hypothetical protein